FPGTPRSGCLVRESSRARWPRPPSELRACSWCVSRWRAGDPDPEPVGKRVPARGYDLITCLDSVQYLYLRTVMNSDGHVHAMSATVGAGHEHVVVVLPHVLKQRGGGNRERVGNVAGNDTCFYRRADFLDGFRAGEIEADRGRRAARIKTWNHCTNLSGKCDPGFEAAGDGSRHAAGDQMKLVDRNRCLNIDTRWVYQFDDWIEIGDHLSGGYRRAGYDARFVGDDGNPVAFVIAIDRLGQRIRFLRIELARGSEAPLGSFRFAGDQQVKTPNPAGLLIA